MKKIRLQDEWIDKGAMKMEFEIQMQMNRNFKLAERERQLGIEHIDITKLPVGAEITIKKDKE